ncbi:hypothetical protein MARLIPOL_17588 [Marinobacter lipolyticus SM19]|uniref:Sulfatase-modifying factor enzyme-like domain-containing protein n=2 Tax=Marinobacter lipolyticus TaxID=209639 RepID=R8AWG4_9GAMM|nr:hypothetical protein MARLIPOL_17588 [Marinobacter lipolyticus SM19]
MKMLIMGKIKTVTYVMLLAFVFGCSPSSQESSDTEIEKVLLDSKRNLVFVEGGEFWLGDVGNESGAPFTPILDNNKPPKLVEIDSFSILAKEVTWGEFLTYLHDVGRAEEYTIENGFSRAVRLPIVANNDPDSPNYKDKPARSPNFHEAENYCSWLAEKTGHPYALPSEAQWEFAARNRGQSVPFATDTGELDIDVYLQRSPVDPMHPVSGNALVHSSNQVERRPAGSYPPSPLGLHDMTGSVAEWTRDWFHPGFDHLSSDNPVAVEAPSSAPSKRSVRDLAGYGDHSGGLATVYARHGEDVDSPDQGFRCVVNHPESIN